MRDLELDAIVSKNEVSTANVDIPLIELIAQTQTGEKEVRICVNNEDIVWAGYTWQALPIQIGSVETDISQLPRFDLKLSNINRVLEEYFDESDGAVGSTVTIRVVRSQALDQAATFKETFDVQSATITDEWVTLTCGFDGATNTRRPRDLYKASRCDRKYGDVTCGISDSMKATYPTCDGTYLECKMRGNIHRFKGVPTIKTV